MERRVLLEQTRKSARKRTEDYVYPRAHTRTSYLTLFYLPRNLTFKPTFIFKISNQNYFKLISVPIKIPIKIELFNEFDSKIDNFILIVELNFAKVKENQWQAAIDDLYREQEKRVRNTREGKIVQNQKKGGGRKRRR